MRRVLDDRLDLDAELADEIRVVGGSTLLLCAEAGIVLYTA